MYKTYTGGMHCTNGPARCMQMRHSLYDYVYCYCTRRLGPARVVQSVQGRPARRPSQPSSIAGCLSWLCVFEVRVLVVVPGRPFGYFVLLVRISECAVNCRKCDVVLCWMAINYSRVCCWQERERALGLNFSTFALVNTSFGSRAICVLGLATGDRI